MMNLTSVHEDLVSRGNKLPITASLLNTIGDPSRTSAKYKTTDDVSVVNQLNDLGWFIDSYKQVKARDLAKVPYKGYVATYHNPSFPELDKEGHLTLLQRNSKDGIKTFSFSVGFYRLVCTNGLIVGRDIFEPLSIKHTGDLPSQVANIVLEASKALPNIYDRITVMQTTILEDDQAFEFAKRAAELRFTDGSKTVDPKALLVARRAEDQGNSLWKVFNRVQENLIKSDKGFKTTNSIGKERAVRSVSNIDLTFKVNTGLWTLSESYAN